jgi:hypothetical protein
MSTDRQTDRHGEANRHIFATLRSEFAKKQPKQLRPNCNTDSGVSSTQWINQQTLSTQSRLCVQRGALLGGEVSHLKRERFMT